MASQPPNTPPPDPSQARPVDPRYVDPRYVDPRAQREYARNARQWNRAQAQAARAQFQAARAQQRAMRRRSILGPVLLVAIGVIALLSTTRMVDPHAVFAWYARWWPLLLIAGGAVLLLEWALDTRSVNAGVPRGTRLGGGAVWLIILLVFVGLAASGTHAIDWSQFHNTFQDDDISQVFMGPQHQSDQQLSQAIPSGAMVSIENDRGDITVASGEQAASSPQAGMLTLALHDTIYGGSDSDAQKRFAGFKPAITTSGNTVLVHINGGDSISANVVVSLPAKTALDLHAHHGDITVTGQQADVAIASDHGDVKLDTIAGGIHGKLESGDFSAHAVTGDVTMHGRHFGDVTVSDVTGAVTLDGDFNGDRDTHVEHIAGPFHLHSSRTDFEAAKLDGSFSLDSGDLSAEQAAGPMKIATRSKDISLSSVSGALTIDNSNGSVDVESALPLGDYNITNRSGHVKITLPPNASFTVDARANEGEMQSDFALTKTGSDNAATLTGTVGSGGPRLTLTADRGDVELVKGDLSMVVPPAPPVPPRIMMVQPPKPPRK